jgi:ATP-dependent Clp protease ATP-binding subunit ClpA
MSPDINETDNDSLRILQAAGAIAVQLGHAAIEAPDLLFALYALGDIPVSCILRNAIEKHDLQNAQPRLWGNLPSTSSRGRTAEAVDQMSLPIGLTARPILHAAYEYATSFGSLLNSNHLAFALLQDDRIRQTLIAAHMTNDQFDDMISQVMNLMSGQQSESDTPQAVPQQLPPDVPPRQVPRRPAEAIPSHERPGVTLFARNNIGESPSPGWPAPLRAPPAGYTGVADSAPDRHTAQVPPMPDRADSTPSAPVDTSALGRFGRDLTKLAREGKLRPFVGREKEIRRCIQILCRESKSNPVLIGEPGVGKTAIAEGVAKCIASGNVPPALDNARIVLIETSNLLAGAGTKGEFEERLKEVTAECNNLPVAFSPVNGVEPAGDGLWHVEGNTRLANFNRALKSSIKSTRGSTIAAAVAEELSAPPTVGLTTDISGYRFKVLELRENSITKLEVLRLHTIIFIDELHTVIGLGASGNGGTDGANTLKPALARGELSLFGATTLDDYKKHFHKDAAFRRRCQVVKVLPPSVADTVEILKGLRGKIEKHYKMKVKISDAAIQAAAELSDRYINDRFLPDKAIDLIDEAASAAAMLLSETEGAPEQCQLDKEQIEDTLSQLTGVPVGAMREGESAKLLKMEEALHKRVIGQDAAVAAVSRAVRRARAGLQDPNKPIGSFLFLGPTGVGKTEVARGVQRFLWDNDDIIRLDMSEYQEKHSVARLIGAPPGYVGYDEGGALTEAVRRRPYCVVLFDEIEKAHPDVFNVLLQVLDDGRLTDGQGVTVDFKNVLVIMTSNIGGHTLMHAPAEMLDAGGDVPPVVMEELKQTFKPEFLNRLDRIVVFHMLAREHLGRIIENLLGGVRILLAPRRITLEVTEGAKDFVLKNGWNPEFGARPLKRAVDRLIRDPLAERLLEGTIVAGAHVEVDLTNDFELAFNVQAEAVAEAAKY